MEEAVEVSGLDTSDKFQKPFSDSKAFGRDTKAPYNAENISTTATIESTNPSEQAISDALEESNNNDKSSPDVKDQEETNRGEWGNHFEYFLTSLGLAVGLGNVWRFPYVVYTNGGGTFLIPYFICLLLCGLPLFFMEMLLGQYAGTSCTKLYARLLPGLRGLGYGMLAIPSMIALYYTVIMAWSFYYMFMGFRSTLPWKSCNSSVLINVATENCYSKYDNDFCSVDETFWNKTCTLKTSFCEHFGSTFTDGNFCFNGTTNIAIADVTRRIASSEEFFKRQMLKQTSIGEVDNWTNYGDCQWEVVGCLALSWTIIALTLVRGMQSYGKLTYFITLFPYVVLTIFLIMGSQKDGFKEGITDFYMKADWERLFSDFDIWVAACTQIFYSLGVSVGSHLLLCSYNRFDNNCHRDVWLIGFGNCITSIYAGFVVFGTLGTLAANNGVPIQDVITEGAGLTFQAYPEAIAQMENAPVFNFLFFLMLCLLAMSSIVGTWEPTVAAILDELPQLRKYRSYIYLSSCFIAFLGGLSCCFPSGIFMFNLLNDHTANTIVYFAFIEIVVVAWFYGVNNFLDNVDEMTVPVPWILRWFWKICWVFITPALILVITVINFTTRKKDQHEGYVYPDAVQALAYLIELFPLAIVLFITLWTVGKNRMATKDTSFLAAKPLWSPSAEWGPRADRPKKQVGSVNLAYYEDLGLDDIPKTEL